MSFQAKAYFYKKIMETLFQPSQIILSLSSPNLGTKNLLSLHKGA